MLFGGLAKDRPYPGSTIVTAFNQGITGLVKTLAVEIAPHRVNAVHPGVVGWVNHKLIEWRAAEGGEVRHGAERSIRL